MESRIEYLSALCEQFNAELLENKEEQLFKLPFEKEQLMLSFVVPEFEREYDLEILRGDKVLFEDWVDETEDELEVMFRKELSSSVKELMEMNFSIVEGEVVFP